MKNRINTHNLIIEFGKHKGERWTRVPISYLKWLINAGTQHALTASAELKRRGVILKHELEVSSHAIDRASQTCLLLFMEDRSRTEGIYSWLHNIASLALKTKEHPHQKEIVFNGIKFVFEYGEVFPTLKTLYPVNKK